MTMLRTSMAIAVLLAAAPFGIVRAQGTPRSADNPCFRARAAPDCGVFFLTNTGVLFIAFAASGAFS